jgi:hypothetical protein
MSDTPPGPEDAPPPVRVREKKPMGMRPNTERAVREVLDRKKAGLSPSYKDVARRNGVSWRSLKTAVSKVLAGELHLGLPTDIEEMHIDAGVEMQRSLRLLNEMEQFCNDALEGLLKQARHFSGRGKLLAYRDLGIPLVIQDLHKVTALKIKKEEGYMAILDKLNAEKRAKAPMADIQAEVVRSDPQSMQVRAREALMRQIPTEPVAPAPPP